VQCPPGLWKWDQQGEGVFFIRKQHHSPFHGISRSNWKKFCSVFFIFFYFWGQHCCLTEASIIGNDLFVFYKFPLPSTFYFPLALPLFQRPWPFPPLKFAYNKFRKKIIFRTYLRYKEQSNAHIKHAQTEMGLDFDCRLWVLLFLIAATFFIITLSIFSAFFIHAYKDLAYFVNFRPCWLLVSCKSHHLALLLYPRVSQPEGHRKIFGWSRQTRYYWNWILLTSSTFWRKQM